MSARCLNDSASEGVSCSQVGHFVNLLFFLTLVNARRLFQEPKKEETKGISNF